MTWKNIEASREIRAWGKIIVKTAVVVTVVAIGFKDEIKEAGHKVKEGVKKIFKHKPKTIEADAEEVTE